MILGFYCSVDPVASVRENSFVPSSARPPARQLVRRSFSARPPQ